jgi:serine/threonine-protein kinase
MFIGRYEIRGLLGRGGMGRVYKVRRPELDRMMALKLLDPSEMLASVQGFEELRRSFRFEAETMGGIDHENIAAVWDLDEHRNKPFMVMEYFCMNLGTLIGETYEADRPTRRVPPERGLHYAAQTLTGLARLHASGIIHRDVKPYNLMLTRGDTVKMIDFGLSKLRGEYARKPPGMMVGSPYYASPEQERDPEAVDQRTDLYAAGVLLFRLVTGRLPDGEDPDVSDDPLLGPDWTGFFRRALAPDPERRFGDAWSMLEEVHRLEGIWQSSRERACAVPPETRGQRRGLAESGPRTRPVKTGPRNRHPFEFLNGLFQPLEYHAGDFLQEGPGYRDRSTGIVWRRFISCFPMRWSECGPYLDRASRRDFSGSGQGCWRLPTVEELVTLLRPKQRPEDFCLEPLFDPGKRWLWSSDRRTNVQAWFVDVQHGFVAAQDFTCLFFVLPVLDAAPGRAEGEEEQGVP